MQKKEKENSIYKKQAKSPKDLVQLSNKQPREPSKLPRTDLAHSSYLPPSLPATAFPVWSQPEVDVRF